MTNQETKNRFAQILADAQAKAEAQANGKKVATPKKVIAKPTQVVQPAVQVPVQDSKPIFAYRQPFDLTRLIAQTTKPELSNVTIADIVGEVQPQPIADLRIIHYSDKCVVVVGNTKANKERLRAIGGKYNAWLKCGEGWVFPKNKEAVIKAEFSL